MVDVQEQIAKCHEFIEASYLSALHSLILKGERSIVISFSDVLKFDPDLSEYITNEPEDALRSMEIAIQQFNIAENVQMRVRLKELTSSFFVKVRDIRSEHINKLIVLEGLVRQASDVRPQVVSAKFECPACGNVMTIPQIEQKFREPSRCSCGRRGRFRLLSKDLVDAQRLVLEESTEALEGGEQPKRLSVFLREDLVEPKMEKRTTPGAKVRVVGIIKEVPVQAPGGTQLTRFDLVAEANNIEPIEETYEDIVITPEDEQQIKELANDPRIYQRLINSIAPSIYGHEDIKGALVLQLMGGIRKEKGDGTVTKGDIHILLVGDPGAAKSSLLLYMSKAAPKARYVAGRSASSAGITATVVKDEFLRGWALEAGAIVLANGGFLLLDEMDKMTVEDTSALHEAMAQQSYHPDTEILFADGTTRKIGEFVNKICEENKDKIKRIGDCELVAVKNLKMLTTDFKEIFPIDIKKISRHKAPSKFVEIEYSNGRKITVTPEHPVFVYENGVKEIEAQHIKKGMLAPSPKKLPTQTQKPFLIIPEETTHKEISFPSTGDRQFSRFLGYLTSEGHSHYNPPRSYAEIGISNTNQHINAESNYLLSNLFNTAVNKNVRYANKTDHATKDLTTYQISSIPLYHFFRENFMHLTNKAPKKKVEDIVRRLELPFKREFLRTAFKGDGLVDKERMGYRTASYELAKDYQDILLQDGMYSYITRDISEGKLYYKVILSGQESMERFYGGIVENDDHRLEKIRRMIERSKQRRNDRDVMPPATLKEVYQMLKDLKMCDGYFYNNIDKNQNAHRETVKRYIIALEEKIQKSEHIIKSKESREIRRTLNIPTKEIAKVLQVSVSSLYNYEKRKDAKVYPKIMKIIKSMGQEKIHRIKEKIKAIKKFIGGDIRLITIKGIKIIDNKDIKWVYDVTVEPTRTFISEGLVLHNTVTISKANIQATLRARTSVLAAANPKLGRFDPYQPIAAQIDLPPTLINRFDLIFPVRDLPNKEKDTLIATHVLATQQQADTTKPEIPVDLLKRYIAYVRQNIHPKLTSGAVEEIKDFYVTLRNSGTTGEEGIRPIPISARQLEALVRLAEGSARVRLSQKVTRGDAKKAISILRYCLMQVGFDYETGQIDIDRISTGIPASTRNKIIIIREIINEIEARGKKAIPIEDIMSEAVEKNITEAQVEEIIEKLKREGEVYEPRRGWISKI